MTKQVQISKESRESGGLGSNEFNNGNRGLDVFFPGWEDIRKNEKPKKQLF